MLGTRTARVQACMANDKICNCQRSLWPEAREGSRTGTAPARRSSLRIKCLAAVRLIVAIHRNNAVLCETRLATREMPHPLRKVVRISALTPKRLACCTTGAVTCGHRPVRITQPSTERGTPLCDGDGRQVALSRCRCRQIGIAVRLLQRLGLAGSELIRPFRIAAIHAGHCSRSPRTAAEIKQATAHRRIGGLQSVALQYRRHVAMSPSLFSQLAVAVCRFGVYTR